MSMSKLNDYLSVPSAFTTGGITETQVTTTADQESATFADMRDYEQAMLVLLVLDYDVDTGGNSNTLTLSAIEATDSSGTSAQLVSGQSTAEASADDATAVVCVTADMMDTTDDMRYIGARVESDGTDKHDFAVLCIRGEPKYTP